MKKRCRVPTKIVVRVLRYFRAELALFKNLQFKRSNNVAMISLRMGESDCKSEILDRNVEGGAVNIFFPSKGLLILPKIQKIVRGGRLFQMLF